MTKIILFLFIELVSFSGISAQEEMDSTRLKAFISDYVLPLANKNMERILEFTQFPLKGDWGFKIGLNKEELEWTKDDFVEGFNKLIDNSIRDCLKQLTYDKIAFVDIEDYGRQIMVYCSWKLGDFEKGLIFKFSEMEEEWKLTVIQGAG